MTGAVAAELRTAVIVRANNRCEYCGMPDTATLFAHEVDHIIAAQHEGISTFENLALACFHCNRHKGPNIATIDPQSRQLVRLFNPRIDHWNEHFQLRHGEIAGLTAVGRGTAALLQFNSPQRLQARRSLVRSGLWSGA
jgi:hypothetical protein